jgi:hypothetical protein
MMPAVQDLVVDQPLHIQGPDPQHWSVGTMTITPTGTVIVSAQTQLFVQQLTVQDGRDPRGAPAFQVLGPDGRPGAPGQPGAPGERGGPGDCGLPGGPAPSLTIQASQVAGTVTIATSGGTGGDGGDGGTGGAPIPDSPVHANGGDGGDAGDGGDGGNGGTVFVAYQSLAPGTTFATLTPHAIGGRPGNPGNPGGPKGSPGKAGRPGNAGAPGTITIQQVD